MESLSKVLLVLMLCVVSICGNPTAAQANTQRASFLKEKEVYDKITAGGVKLHLYQLQDCTVEACQGGGIVGEIHFSQPGLLDELNLYEGRVFRLFPLLELGVDVVEIRGPLSSVGAEEVVSETSEDEETEGEPCGSSCVFGDEEDVTYRLLIDSKTGLLKEVWQAVEFGAYALLEEIQCVGPSSY
jgi:hypothetical protein